MESPEDSGQSQLYTNELCSYEEVDKCYICHGPETYSMPFMDPNPCSCKGSMKIHNCCLFPIIDRNDECSICKSSYVLIDGPNKWFYDNGAIRMEGTIKNNMDQGTRNYFYKDGSKRAEEFCIDSKKNGHCKYYKEGGILSSDEFYELGKRIGHSKFYFPDGRIWAEEFHVNGLKEGLSKFRYSNGNLQCEENFKNGKREGLSTFYHECGLVHCEIYYENDVEVLRRDHFVKPGAKK
jgi:antitoxin component YwqK of YwqJK toxin-antitoxin module